MTDVHADGGGAAATGTAEQEIKRIAQVAIAGLVGGGLSWVYAFVTLQSSEAPSFGWIFAYAPLGAGAALIGVFCLANTDLSSIARGFAFALLCGFSWKPVYDAGGALLVQRLDEAQAADVEERVDEAFEGLEAAQGATDEELVRILDGTADGIAEAVRRLGDVRDPDRRRELEGQLESAVVGVTQLGMKHPEICIDAVQRIGVAAREAGSAKLEDTSVQMIKRYGKTYPLEGTTAPAAAERVEESIERIRPNRWEGQLRPLESGAIDLRRLRHLRGGG